MMLFLLYLLVFLQEVGAFWYLLSVEREDNCWRSACKTKNDVCEMNYLYCGSEHLDGYDKWQNVSAQVLQDLCSPDDSNTFFSFGIYGQSLTSGIVETKDFFSKLGYCFWWGLQNLRQSYFLQLLPK